MYNCYISTKHDSKTKNRGHLPRMLPDRRPGSALSRPRASGRVVLEERSLISLVSLTHHRASPYMRGTECAQEENSRELRNIFRANLATRQDSRPSVLVAGILGIVLNMHKRIHLASLSQANSYHQYLTKQHPLLQERNAK